jgi:uncharacterized iron-regulated membrane protein
MAGPRVASWFYWHSAVGATFGLLLTLICWSGTFATLGHEIDWLLEPKLRVSHQAQQASLADLYNAVEKRLPRGLILSLDAPIESGFAAEALVDVGRGVTVRVYVDPHTAEVLGATSMFNAWRFFRSFHANLFGFFDWGRYVVSAMGLALLALVTTMLVFWKRWWTHFLDARAPFAPVGAWSTLHKLFGLWFLWFAALIGVTGTWYLVDIARFHYFDTRPSMTHPPALPAGPSRDPISVAETIARAQAARPDITITKIRFGVDGRPDYVEGWAGHTLVRPRANHVYTDPRDGTVLASQSAHELTAYWRLSEAIDPLHFGDFAGLPSKIVWFIAGLFLSASGFTGALLLARSTRRRGGKPRAAGRVLRWIGLGIGIGVVIFAAADGWREYLEFVREPGTSAGVQPSVSSGVLAFIVSWIALTLAGMGWWAWELR